MTRIWGVGAACTCRTRSSDSCSTRGSTRTSGATTSAAWSSPRPVGDPGWFGPGSAVWHVHSHMHALIFGLQCAAYHGAARPVDLLDGHAPLAAGEARRADGTARCREIDPEGRRGTPRPFDRVLHRHGLRLHRDRRAAGPVGARRCTTPSRAPAPTARATTPTIRTGCAGTTRPWSGAWPPRMSSITRTRCAARNSTATTASSCASVTRWAAPICPTTKAETLECLESYLPRLAVTHGTAMATGPGLPLAQSRGRLGHPRHHAEVGQAVDPAHRPQHRRAHRPARHGLVGDQRPAPGAPGPIPEFRQAQARVDVGHRRCRTPCRRTNRATIRSGRATSLSAASRRPESRRENHPRCEPVHSFRGPRPILRHCRL